MLLEGRSAIVSGIGPGMGRDISVAFARAGADVAMGARTESMLEKVAAEVEALGRRALWRRTDIAVEEDCRRLARATREELGRIDVLVNNAFVQPPFETIEQNTLDVWRDAFEVNVFGTLAMTKAVIPYMKEQGRGSIVFINSMSMRRIQPLFGAYSATKSALLTAVRTLAVELGPYGIRVNSILPGYIWGSSLEWYFGELAKQRGVTPQEVYDGVASETCLKQIPTSEEIADAVLFFASDMSRVVTGQSLGVNAGHWFD